MNRHQQNPASIVDIARIAHVSTATVSQALRGVGRVSLKTRNHIRKVARELGYRPNLVASLLARQHQDHAIPCIPIALLGMGAPPFPSHHFVESFSPYARRIGFQVVVPEPELGTHLPTLLRVLYHRGVRGIIFNHNFDTSLITEQDASRFSLLVFGNSLSDYRLHRISMEVFQSTTTLWEMAWKRGYRRIGAALCRHQALSRDDLAREAAILACEKRYNALHLPPFVGGHFDYAGLVQWIKEVKPDAIISFSSASAYHLWDIGFRIPEDIGFCSLHRKKSGENITGYHQDHEVLSHVAAHQIESMICRNETGFPEHPHAVLVDPVFKEGNTLPVKSPAP